MCENEVFENEVFENEVCENEVCENEVFENEVCENEVCENEVCENEVCENEVFEDALNIYQSELKKSSELEQIFITRLKEMLEAKQNYLLSRDEVLDTIDNCILAKKKWELQERVVKFILREDKNYNNIYKQFKAYIYKKRQEEMDIENPNKNSYTENISPFDMKHKL